MANSRWMAIGRAIARLWRAWAWLAQSVFGAWTWESPRWLRRVDQLAAGFHRWGSSIARRHPRRAGAVIIAVLALAFAGHAAWRWYQLKPKPEFAAFSVLAPARTRRSSFGTVRRIAPICTSALLPRSSSTVPS